MDWDETDDHDFSDSEVDYYMGKEPRSTKVETRHIHQHRQPKICLRCYGTGWISIPSMNSVPCSCSQIRKLRAGA